MVDTPQILGNVCLSDTAIRENISGVGVSGLRIEVEEALDSTNAALKRRAT